MKPELTVSTLVLDQDIPRITLEEFQGSLMALERFGLDEVMEHARLLLRLDCSPPERLQLLNRLRPVVTDEARSLHYRMEQGRLPLDAQLLEELERLAHACSLLADVYKSILLELATQSVAAAPESVAEQSMLRDDLITACYGAIHYLAEEIRFRYEGYREPVDGSWREIHHIYRYARHVITTSDLPARGEHGARDDFYLIEHIYKRSLLLGLCNPYHFSIRCFRDLSETLNQRAALCAIRHEAMPAREHNLFSIDFSSDYPAAPVLATTGRVEAGERYAILDTGELVEALNTEIDTRARKLFLTGQGPLTADDLRSIEMLRRLVMNWGQHPVRRDSRTSCSVPAEIMVGFTRLVPRVIAGEGLDLAGYDGEVYRGELVDSSRMGFQLQLHSERAPEFRIGDMVVVNTITGDDRQQALGVVRWVRYASARQLRVGLFVIGTAVQPASVHAGERRIDALELTATEGLPLEHKILIAPLELYRPGRQFRIGDDRDRVQAGMMLLSGADFVAFSYRPAL